MKYTSLIFFIALVLALGGCGKDSSQFSVGKPTYDNQAPAWQDAAAAASCPSGTKYGCLPGQQCKCYAPGELDWLK